jgi:hypothetical protein
MITTIIDFKWHILLFAEIVGWILTVFLFFSRYYFQSKIFSWLFLVMIIVSDYLPSITLPILDAIYNTSDLKTWIYESLLFNLVIIGLFIFSITLGKKYVLIIDNKIMNYVIKIKKKTEVRLSK